MVLLEGLLIGLAGVFGGIIIGALLVYLKNEQAIHFYRKNGFKIQAEQLDEPTREKEYVMEWNSGN